MEIELLLPYITPQKAFALLTLLLLGVQCIYLYRYYGIVLRFTNPKKKKQPTYASTLPPISIILYAKNDAENLRLSLPLLLKQHYPLFEVIVVNDGSTDESRDLVTRLEQDYPHLYQTYVPENLRNVSHKKLALTLGMKAAKYDIVVHTHANALPTSDRWLEQIGRNFLPEISVVIGHSFVREGGGLAALYRKSDRVLNSLHYLSYALLQAPYMAKSPNLAYRKECFFHEKGFSKHLSLRGGDDDLFVNQIVNNSNTRVELSPESLLELHYDRPSVAWREEKLRYNFTTRRLKSSAKTVFAFERISRYLLYVAAALWIITEGIHSYWLAAPLLLLLLFGLFYSILLNRISKRITTQGAQMPIFLMDSLSPFVSVWFSLVGYWGRKRNFTHFSAR